MAGKYSGRDRDFIGYGGRPPHPKWPQDSRLALNFVINIEEGAERSIGDGDGASEFHLTEVAASPVPKGERDLSAESMFEYGSRVGFWRLHRVFSQAGFPVTIFACAKALARNPAIARVITEADWDVCAHGNRWVEHYNMSEEEERAAIAEAVHGIEHSTGSPPRGWYCRYAPSINTRRLLLEHGGFIYDSDAYNDELPYWVDMGQHSHLVVPYTLNTNDAKFGRGNLSTAGQFYECLRDTFDLLYAEGERAPKMMSVGLHQRITGHPSRCARLVRFLEHVASHRQVWVCRRIDIAEHWRTHFPPVRENVGFETW